MKKGINIYQPDISLSESDLLQESDKSAINEKIKESVKTHIEKVLEPLIIINDNSDDVPASVRGITHQLHEELGIISRQELEDMISGLDTDSRRIVRQKGVRLGPVLVFMPALGKPACVRLKALLWSLWNNSNLPANVPRDGSVSEVIDVKKINKTYYQSIGYPVYGTRAIRADMLDRLVCEIYDTAKDGKFQAQHKMAEWLGCPITELYDILKDLGHKKIHDPAEQAQEEAKVSEKKLPGEGKDVESKPTEEEKTPSAEAEQKTEPVKPELATFALKRGKAAHTSSANKKTHKSKKGVKKHKGKQGPVTISAQAKTTDENNPFAVLKQLKKSNE